MGEKPRSRSHLSDRRLGRAVAEGRKVVFEFPTGLPKTIRGYVFGWDAYHWGVVSFDKSGTATEHLVHKGNAATVTLTTEDITSEHDTAQQLYSEMVGLFRAWLRESGVTPPHVAPRSA